MLVNNYSRGCCGHCNFPVPTIQKGLQIHDNTFRDMSSVLAVEERKVPINLNISSCKNNHLCHIRYGWGGRDPSCKDSSLSLIFSNADCPEKSLLVHYLSLLEGCFCKKEGEKNSGHFPLSCRDSGNR